MCRKSSRRGDHRSSADFAKAKSVAARRKSCYFPTEKIPESLRIPGSFAFRGEELLLQGLLNSNSHGDGHADHGGVGKGVSLP